MDPGTRASTKSLNGWLPIRELTLKDNHGWGDEGIQSGVGPGMHVSVSMWTPGCKLRILNGLRLSVCQSLLQQQLLYCRWTDYTEEYRMCRAQNEAYERQQQEAALHPPAARSGAHLAGSGQGWDSRGQPSSCHCSEDSEPWDGEQWGFCPPIGVDPRSLVRPLNKAVNSSTRPTGLVRRMSPAWH